jgi:hypothetical protein
MKSLRRLGAVAFSRPDFLQFPERREDGLVVGIETRYLNPIIEEDGSETRFRFKHRRGFKYADDWDKTELGGLVICEGGFDTAAAMDAGLAAIGRPSRQCTLDRIHTHVKDFQGTVFLIVENDAEADEQKEIRSELVLKADELGEATGRRVYVASPPKEHKDIADWWVSLTDGRGYELTPADRRKLGLQMLQHLEDDALREAIEENKREAETISERIMVEAELARAARTSTVEGDLDYNDQGGCSFHRLFTKADEEQFSNVLAARLACKSWSCDPCFRRIIGFEWKRALTLGFARTVRVTKKVFTDIAAAEKEIDRTKGHGHLWALFSELDEDAGKSFVLFTSAEVRGKADDLFSICDSIEEFRRLAKSLHHHVDMVDREAPRPIRTSKGLRRTPEVTMEDWYRKIDSIIENADNLFAGVLTVTQCAELKKKAKEMGMDRDYLIAKRDGVHFAFANFEFEGLHLMKHKSSGDLEFAIKDIDSVQASGRWRAQHTQGWDITTHCVTPEHLKATASRLGLRSQSVDVGPTASMVRCEKLRESQTTIDRILLALEQ